MATQTHLVSHSPAASLIHLLFITLKEDNYLFRPFSNSFVTIYMLTVTWCVSIYSHQSTEAGFSKTLNSDVMDHCKSLDLRKCEILEF